MQVHTVQAGDGALLREVMLRMYAESPNVFGETLEQAQARTEAGWDELAALLTDSARFVGFMVRNDERTLGFVVGVVGRAVNGALDHSLTDIVSVGRMWVDPAVRRQGVGRMLIDAVIDWGRGKGAQQVELEVTEDNHAAIEFYQRAGFAFTGYREPFPPNPLLQMLYMARGV